MSYREILNNRLETHNKNFMDAGTTLFHFALINYALPKSRLEKYIPSDKFDIPEFDINGHKMAMMSAVPFLDIDFHFINICPFLKFKFGQTNYRVYVIDKKTGQHLVWFFGTTLGSHIVKIPRLLWKIPWHHAKYNINCKYSESEKRYLNYELSTESEWCDSNIVLEDTGLPIDICDGFSDYDTLKLILTHPVTGYFYRLDKQLGTYSIWHEEMKLTKGNARNLYFSLYERLGLLSAEEMQNPHSVFICPEIYFKINLPPKRIII